MISVKVVYRSATCGGADGSVCYEISSGRNVKVVESDIRLRAEEWDAFIAMPRSVQQMERVIRDLKDLSEIAGGSCGGDVGEIVRQFGKLRGGGELLEFFEQLRRELKAVGNYGTAACYASTARSIGRYLNGVDLPLAAISERFVVEYDSYLRGRGVCRNTISFYMRVLRAVLNRADARGLVRMDSRWFRKVFTGVAPTVKRALGVGVIRDLLQLDLSGCSNLALARDLFVFSFFARGMAFVDMAYLERSDINGDYMEYRRRKTSQLMRVRVEARMRAIIDRYACEGSAYVFPLLKTGDRKEYSSAISAYNRRLKRLSDMIGASRKLTSYMARHSWATAARDCNIPISVISAGMGHTSERVTRIYLDSISNAELDDANRRIMELIK